MIKSGNKRFLRMRKIVLKMTDHKLFTNKFYPDPRGYFYESFPRAINEELGEVFCQDNISFSRKGVVRGLHYQWDKPMGKLVQTISGKIIDYIVDIRHGSPSFGKCWKFELSEENKNLLWVPPGYAHGFEAIEDSYVMYKCSAYYNKGGESAINILDPELNLDLQIRDTCAIMSEKDRVAQRFSDYSNDPKFFYEEIG